MTVSRFTHIFTNDLVSFVFLWRVFYCIYVPHLYPSGDGHLGCLLVLAVVNSTAVNDGVRVSF